MSPTRASLRRYSRDPRLLVAVPLMTFIVISGIYYFIQRANELSSEALSSRLLLFVLWNINFILILGIGFVLLRGIVKLVLERKRGLLGSRFRSRLVTTYVVTSLVPIAVLFVFATDLLQLSIDRWFNTPVQTIVQNGAAIAEAVGRNSEERARAAAVELAASLEAGDEEASLDHVRRFHPVDAIGIYRDGLLVRLVADPKAPVHEIAEPPPRFFADVASKGWAVKTDPVPDGKWVRVAVRSGPADAALAGVFIPGTLSRMLDENVIARQNFDQLDAQRPALKASQSSLFLTVTLSILFGTLWTALYVSRRITVPVEALARGTRALAGGGYGHRIDVAAADEFGVLIDSFNTMSTQLQSQRAALTSSNLELQTVNERLDEDRAYLETVMESISTGIIAFDRELSLLSVNQAAVRMLRLENVPAGTALDQYFRETLPPMATYLEELHNRVPRSREMTLILGGELHYLELSAAPLGQNESRGWVLAIEDSTRLVQAQKLAAWSEAARRIAHEIKNPLTPIQLSAERILKRYRQGDPNIQRILEEGCETIVSEVGQLKSMVDEFSRFARMPAIHLRRTDLIPILEEVARLYRDVKPGVDVRVEAEGGPSIVIDPEQIRRSLINLLDNAVEATDAGGILLRLRREKGRVMIDVIDSGRGIPDENKERLFLPYFSTKKEGTGLGLAIVHRIVNDHEGRISVHDNTPQGTWFEIELPA